MYMYMYMYVDLFVIDLYMIMVAHGTNDHSDVSSNVGCPGLLVSVFKNVK